MSDRWYRDCSNPMAYDGSPQMVDIPDAGVGTVEYLGSLPPSLTRFAEMAAALERRGEPHERSLAAAQELQLLCGLYFGQPSELENYQLAMAQIAELEGDVTTGDYIVNTFDQRFIAKLGGYSLDFYNGPTITLRMYDAGVSRRRSSLPRVLRVAEAKKVPVMNVDLLLPYSA